MSLAEKIVSLAGQGELMRFKIPGNEGVSICLERRMIENCMKVWKHKVAPEQMDGVWASVKRHVKQGVQAMKYDRLTSEQRDTLAADLQLFYAHELLFADGEKYIQETPTEQEMRDGLAKMAHRSEGTNAKH